MTIPLLVRSTLASAMFRGEVSTLLPSVSVPVVTEVVEPPWAMNDLMVWVDAISAFP